MRFYLVAPVTQTEAADRWAAGGLDGGVIPGAYKIARTLAQGRLQQELARLRDAGADADGEVVDPTPLDAIGKLASREEVDEIIVSTCRGACPAGWPWICPPHQTRHQAAGDPHQRTAGPSL